MVLHHTLTSDKMELKRGTWSHDEDRVLVSFIEKHGHPNWRALPKLAGLKRCGKSCRLRWVNYLRPGLKRGNFTRDEEEAILKLHESLGNKWSQIASHLPGRTDNEIKNVWNSHLKKRIKPAGNEPEKSSTSSPSPLSDKSSVSYCESNAAEDEVKEEDPFEGLLALPWAAFGYVNMLEDASCFTSTVSGEEARNEDERRWAAFLGSELVQQDTSYGYPKCPARNPNN